MLRYLSDHMKLSSRAKLNLTIVFVTLYMFAAFAWWTYSLVRYGYKERAMQMEILSTDSIHAAGETSHSMIHMRYPGTDSFVSYYQGKAIRTDTAALKEAILKKFPDYNIRFYQKQQLNKAFLVHVKPSIVKRENEKFRRKRTSWISEGLTMGLIMLVIAIAMFVFLNRILTINQQQNNFLLAVTHELKTPVAGAKLAVQTVGKQIADGQDSLKKMLTMADNNLSRLGKLMDQVLMVTRLDSINVTRIVQPVLLEDLVRETVQDLSSSFPATANVSMELEPDLGVTGDKDQLGMAISNLITNAIKYSPAGQEIVVVRSFVEKGRVALSVEDQGNGIPESEKRNIFRKFYRIGDENTRSSAGSGLGLYLVSKILRQHKAIISVTNNIPRGSVFKIVFRNKV